MRHNGRAQAVPILEALYAGEIAKANAGPARAATPAAELLANVLHTICAIAHDDT